MSYFARFDSIVATPGFWLRLGASGLALGWSAWLFGKLGTQMGAYALFHGGVPHATIGFAERTLAWMLLCVVPLAWLPRRWGAFAAVLAPLVLVEAFFGTINGGFAFSEWAIPAQLLRILLPVALILWLFRELIPFSEITVEWLLRLGIALVFATHGLEAFLGHPGFQDFIIGTADSWLGLVLEESSIQPTLFAIALVDGIVAVLVLAVSWRGLFAWLAFWGLITALARMSTYGWGAYPELFLRFPHFCAPLALWALTRDCGRLPDMRDCRPPRPKR